MDERGDKARFAKTKSGQETRTVIKVGADFYVLASSLSSRRSTKVLVNGESFAVFDMGGDFLESPLEALGFFHQDTRYLSRFELKVAGKTPYYLDSHASNDNAQLRISLSNPDLGVQSDVIELPRNSIHIERDWVLYGAALLHKVAVRNYARVQVQIPLDFIIGVDFADLFEVRGLKRLRRGDYSEPIVGSNRVRFRYHGLDGVGRFTEIVFEPAAVTLDRDGASFLLTLEPDERKEIEIRVTGGREVAPAPTSTARPLRFVQALGARRSEINGFEAAWSGIAASNGQMDSLLRRSCADLTSIIRHTPEGTFMMAGIPWFATLFGRDSIMTALFALPFNPEIAAGTLRTLAALQGSGFNQARDEQPGKIVHEVRAGEMAATGEVPFGRYYGSVDSTPLFVWLLGEYVSVTGDLAIASELWSNVERALEWIERWGDRDGDMYVEYMRETPGGLANQGWKDSFDAISHADGTLAQPPIALCEVQGYVYAAYRSIAQVAARLGREEQAERLTERAAALKSAFSRDFWLERERTVALALDGNKRPCRVMTSNAAHCLATGLLDADQAAELCEHLLSEEMFTGWGVRTLSSRALRYNPMSYHNGSVWPHDNAIAALGLSGLPDRRAVLRIMDGLLYAAVNLQTGSLPELFCGFAREERLGPVPYPVACHPQAWSAASVFMLLQAMLGMRVMGFDRKLIMKSPVLPRWLDWLKVQNLKVGAGAVSFVIRRADETPVVEVTEQRRDVTVEVLG